MPKIDRDRKRRELKIKRAKPLRNFIWAAFYHLNEYNAIGSVTSCF
jgi:hypothetical protein